LVNDHDAWQSVQPGKFISCLYIVWVTL